MLFFFALLDLFTALVILFEHYLPWRILFVAGLALVTKALLFNDRFLSIIDAFTGVYLFVLIFASHGIVGWVLTGYLMYKFVISIL